VLLIEDDPTVAEVVMRYLDHEGFEARWQSDGGEGLRDALSSPPDIVLLDLMLPTIGGLEVCRRLRQQAPVPVIMLTARGDETDRIVGLELGADDYVAKPFSPRELMARVRAVLRRAQSPAVGDTAPAVLRAADIEVDVGAREVRKDGKLLTVTAREFDLLIWFMRHPRHAFSREDLLEHVWGYTYGDASTVTVHVRRLREKIEDDPSEPELITTVWGVGYRWDE